MSEHFVRPIQLKDLVAPSGMSRRGFIKAFNSHVGTSPGRLLRHMRLEYVKQLLVEEDLPLKEIAERSGFQSENTLCVAFQRVVGLAPKQFQRQYLLSTNRLLRLGETAPPLTNSLRQLPGVILTVLTAQKCYK